MAQTGGRSAIEVSLPNPKDGKRIYKNDGRILRIPVTTWLIGFVLSLYIFMTCLLWYFRDDTGCLDFDDSQFVGRDCFAGSPKSLPIKYFEVYHDRGGWLCWLYPSPSMEFHQLFLRNPGGKWVKLDSSPEIIEDGALIKLGHRATAPKMQFRLSNCHDVTEIRSLWESAIWTMPDDETAPMGEPSLDSIPAPMRGAADGLEWLAWFIQRYRWAAAAAITLLTIGSILTTSGRVQLPSNVNPTPERTP